jgi:hypothetical protein
MGQDEMMEQRKVVRSLRRLASKFKFECISGCTKCCGIVPFSKWEWDRIKEKKVATGGKCPYATDKGCEIYKERPVMCRFFGLTPTLRCPVGGKTSKITTDIAIREALAPYMDIIGKTGIYGPHASEGKLAGFVAQVRDELITLQENNGVEYGDG